jgi:hypothetical protein
VVAAQTGELQWYTLGKASEVYVRAWCVRGPGN